MGAAAQASGHGAAGKVSDQIWVAVIVTAGTLVSALVNTWNSSRTRKEVAGVKVDVAEVHGVVNSRYTDLNNKFEALAAEYNLLLGANNARAKSDESAATFEAGRKEGAESKGV